MHNPSQMDPAITHTHTNTHTHTHTHKHTHTHTHTYARIRYFDSLSKLDQLALLKIIKSGIDNPDSGMGCYAMQPADYDKFKPFFAKVLSEYVSNPTFFGC